MSKLFFSNDLYSKLNSVNDDTLSAWEKINISSIKDINERIIEGINQKYKKIKVDEIKYVSSIDGIEESSTYFGVIQDNNINLAYVFVIPPRYETRSGVLSQQVFPVLSDIIQKNLEYDYQEISNLPVIIINLNEVNFTPAMAINVKSGKIIGFKYFDLFNRDEDEVLLSRDLNPDVNSLKDYDNLLKDSSKGSNNENKYFTIDNESKEIIFETFTLKDGIHVNNEPYWYVIKAYTALYLSFIDNYKINLETFESTISRGNKTLDAFFNYALKLKNGDYKLTQKIYYGAPGTGKSYNIETLLKQKNISDEYIYRVTFHPEYNYTDFIGQLLPVVDSEGNISYEFSKGVFTKALEKAYEDISNSVYLILEEMSRGDCAAIFGDIFQLLDREKVGPYKGYSRYFINNSIVVKDIVRINDDKVKLPPNLFIVGSVNTSDQNVFVMDTAFKRRFDWEYISTRPVKEDEIYVNNAEFELIDTLGKSKNINWIDFYGVLNKFITDSKWLDLGEDKQLGQFFIEFPENVDKYIIKNIIKNKLLHYLWSDIHQVSFKKNIHLFANNITSFSELYESFQEDKNIFNAEFFRCIDLWEKNEL